MLFFDVVFGLRICKLEYCISIFSINSLCFNWALLQAVFLGCFGSKVDAIDYYKSEIEKIGKEVSCSFCTTRLLAITSML